MIQETIQDVLFKQRIRESLRQETLSLHAVTIAKHDLVYTSGDNDESVYFIESGQIKQIMISPEGKECLLTIYKAGDIFGELRLSGLGARLETVIAMEESVIKRIHYSKFLERLKHDALLEGFIQYLTARIANQRNVIANLVMTDSEERLGKTLLNLACTLGRKDSHNIRIEPNITHEELSEMVGTTQRRINLFMQRFRKLGLIETNADHFLIIKAKKLTAYLAQNANSRSSLALNKKTPSYPKSYVNAVP
jgi:CRP/FNR family cyclic AMP-dependent transcriptional regulator